jgi:hypothetical protein
MSGTWKLFQRWLTIGLLLSLFPSVIALVVHRESRRRTAFWDKYQHVQLGMTEREVKDILGPETTEEDMGGITAPWALIWVHGEQRIIVFFIAGPRGECATKKGFLPKSLWETLQDPPNASFVTYP